MTKELILYGVGVVGKELYRYMNRHHPEMRVVCFAVTECNGENTWDGISILSIRDALQSYPDADVILALQEKFHAEVRELLNNLGVEICDVFGIRRMTTLLKEEGIKSINEKANKRIASEDPLDYSMMIISHPELPKSHIYTLLPLMQIPLHDSEQAVLEQLDKYEMQFVRLMGTYLQPEDFSKGENLGRKIFVGMACNAVDAPIHSTKPLPDYIHSVTSGSALQKRESIQEYRDDIGDNRSVRNRDYAELCVTYWLWKNIRSDYIGLCHYRRHFVLDEHAIQLLQSGVVDVVLPRPRLTFPSVKESFVNLPGSSLTSRDYELMMEAIRDEDINCAEYAEKVFSGCVHYPCNMVIARYDIFYDYCRWMFKVLDCMEKFYQAKEILRDDKYLGYAGEMLTTLYFMYHHKEWKRMYVDKTLLS